MPKLKSSTKPKDQLVEKHQGHENHICELVRKRDMESVARMVRDSKYICMICGRTASREENLCLPVEI